MRKARTNKRPQDAPRDQTQENNDAPYFDGKVEALTRVADALAGTRPHVDDSMLRTVIQHMQDAVILMDRDFRVLAINEVALDILDLPRDTRDLILTADIDPGEVTDGEGQVMGYEDSVHVRCARGETVENLVQIYTSKDGRKRYYFVNGSPIRNEKDEVEMVLVVAREITELKKLQIRTEKMLTEMSRQRAGLKCLIDNMPAGVILLDSELRVLGANKTYADYFDPSMRWRAGAHLHELLPLAEESGVLSILRQALKTKQPASVHSFRYEGFPGGVTYWSGSAVPVDLSLDKGAVAGIAMVAVDVTEEINAREKLAELAALAEHRAQEVEAERARLNTTIQSMPIPLIVCDADWKIVAHNRAALELAKAVGVEDVIRHDTDARSILGVMLPDSDGGVIVAGEEGPVSRSMRGEVCTDVVLRCKTSSHRNMTLSFNTAPLRDAQNNVTGVVVAIQDITEQVRSQEQVQEVYRREHFIAEKLQTSFLPGDMPTVDGFEIAERYRPGLDEALVGGDFYDVFRLREEQYGIVIGDVAGKGLKAAVYTAMTKYMLRAYALEDRAPELVLARLNEALAACTPPEVFVTLVYGILDTRDRTFVYANAGHEQPIFYCKGEQFVTTLDVTGRALALARGSSYTTHTVELCAGDLLTLYTDGITDAGWGSNRLGQEGLLELLELGASRPIAELADFILNNALEFASGGLADDAGLLIIRALDREQY